MIDLYFQLRPTDPSNTFFFPKVKRSFFKKSLLDGNIDFGSILAVNMPPFCIQNPIKILQKPDPKRHQNFDRFWLRFLFDFGSILGAKLGPCWPPRRPQDAPGRGRDEPGAPQEAAKTAQEASRGPKTPPRSIFGGFWWLLMDCWTIFGGFLIDFWLNFHRCWIIFFSFLLRSFGVRFIVQRSPAVLPLYGLNAVGELREHPSRVNQ